VKPAIVPAPRAPEPDERDDGELVALAAAGDHRAFAALYRAHADAVYGLLTRLIGPRSERDDLLQDTFVRFHRALPRYRGEARVTTFLHAIAVRVACDHLRARSKRPPIDDAIDDVTANDLPPEQWAEIGEVLQFLDSLTADQRIAFVLREVLDYTYPDIAQLVGCLATTARMRVAAANRALDELRRKR
jgi:RNA polymerase sigma-70 factor (ECF subfamily)